MEQGSEWWEGESHEKIQAGEGIPGLELRMSLYVALPIWRPVGPERRPGEESSRWDLSSERPAHGGQAGRTKHCGLHSKCRNEPATGGWE